MFTFMILKCVQLCIILVPNQKGLQQKLGIGGQFSQTMWRVVTCQICPIQLHMTGCVSILTIQVKKKLSNWISENLIKVGTSCLVSILASICLCVIGSPTSWQSYKIFFWSYWRQKRSIFSFKFSFNKWFHELMLPDPGSMVSVFFGILVLAHEKNVSSNFACQRLKLFHYLPYLPTYYWICFNSDSTQWPQICYSIIKRGNNLY